MTGSVESLQESIIQDDSAYNGGEGLGAAKAGAAVVLLASALLGGCAALTTGGPGETGKYIRKILSTVLGNLFPCLYPIHSRFSRTSGQYPTTNYTGDENGDSQQREREGNRQPRGSVSMQGMELTEPAHDPAQYNTSIVLENPERDDGGEEASYCLVLAYLIAAGVVLAAALVHLLPDAAEAANALMASSDSDDDVFPLGNTIAGAAFVVVAGVDAAAHEVVHAASDSAARVYQADRRRDGLQQLTGRRSASARGGASPLLAPDSKTIAGAAAFKQKLRPTESAGLLAAVTGQNSPASAGGQATSGYVAVFSQRSSAGATADRGAGAANEWGPTATDGVSPSSSSSPGGGGSADSASAPTRARATIRNYGLNDGPEASSDRNGSNEASTDPADTSFSLAASDGTALDALPSSGMSRADELGAASTGVIFVLALTLHSSLAGLAAGAAGDPKQLLDVMVALIAHKGLAAFALGQQLLRSVAGLGWRVALGLFCAFAVSTPIGVGVGAGLRAAASGFDADGPLVGILLAAAAGAFLQVAIQEMVAPPLARRLKPGENPCLCCCGYGGTEPGFEEMTHPDEEGGRQVSMGGSEIEGEAADVGVRRHSESGGFGVDAPRTSGSGVAGLQDEAGTACNSLAWSGSKVAALSIGFGAMASLAVWV